MGSDQFIGVRLADRRDGPVLDPTDADHLRPEQVEHYRLRSSYRGKYPLHCWWWARTTGIHVACDSPEAVAAARILDFDQSIVAFAGMPFTVLWASARSRRHSWTPEFFARTGDGKGVVVSCTEPDVWPRDAHEAVQAACDSAGWMLRIIGPLPEARAANLRWLDGYKQPFIYDADIAAALLAVFAEPTPLFAGADAAGDRLRVLPVLYHLMWRQLVLADLDTVMQDHTLGWTAGATLRQAEPAEPVPFSEVTSRMIRGMRLP